MVQQRLHLGHRPPRCEDRISLQPRERIDAQVAVDQHDPIALGDHDHRHLLTDLRDRADQATAAIGIDDPQIAVAQLEPVQIDLHVASLPALPPTRDLVLRDASEVFRHSGNDLAHLTAHLVLRVPTHYSDDSGNNYATFDPHLVLHHLPRQSGHRRRRVGPGWRRLGPLFRRRDRLAPPPIAVVVAIRRPPRPVRTAVTLALALLSITCVLARPDASVRQKPAATY